MKNIYLTTIKNPSLLIISFLFFSVSLIAQESSESNAINEKVLWANENFDRESPDTYLKPLLSPVLEDFSQ